MQERRKTEDSKHKLSKNPNKHAIFTRWASQEVTSVVHQSLCGADTHVRRFSTRRFSAALRQPLQPRPTWGAGAPACLAEQSSATHLVRIAVDTIDSAPYPKAMEVRFNPELQAKLSGLAAEQGRDSETLVVEAVERLVDRLVDYDAWFLSEVDKGLAAADRGELVDHEAVGKLINSRYPG